MITKQIIEKCRKCKCTILVTEFDWSKTPDVYPLAKKTKGGYICGECSTFKGFQKVGVA